MHPRLLTRHTILHVGHTSVFALGMLFAGESTNGKTKKLMSYHHSMATFLQFWLQFVAFQRLEHLEGYNKPKLQQRARNVKHQGRFQRQAGHSNPKIPEKDIAAHNEQVNEASGVMPRMAAVCSGVEGHHTGSTNAVTECTVITCNHEAGGGTLYYLLKGTMRNVRFDFNAQVQRNNTRVSKRTKNTISIIQRQDNFHYECVGDTYEKSLSARWFKVRTTNKGTGMKKSVYVCMGRTFDCTCTGVDKERHQNCHHVLYWVDNYISSSSIKNK